MERLIIIALIFVVSVACSDQVPEIKKDNPLFSDLALAEPRTMTEHINLKELGIHRPAKVAIKDSLMVVLNRVGKYKLSVYHRNGKLIANFLKSGLKEDEGLYFLTMNVDPEGIVTAYDFGNNKLVELDLKKVGTSEFKPVITHMPEGEKHLSVAKSGSLIISTGVFPKGRYCLMDETGNRNYFLSYPKTPGQKNVSDTLNSYLYASNITKIKPDRSRFVCANMQSGILDIGAHHHQQLVRVLENTLYFPRASMFRKGSRPVAYSADNLFGFIDIEVSDDYIFALYSGKGYRKNKEGILYGNRIVVFDWDGKHVKNYALPTPFKSISYCPEEKAIYGMTDKPVPTLIKYELISVH